MSEPFEGQDTLGLDLEVRRQQEWHRDLQRAGAIAEEQAASINDAFDASTNFTSKFNQQILKLEGNAKQLSQQFRNMSTKSFGQDLEYINVQSRQAALRVEELSLELKQLDAVVARSPDISPARFDRMSSNIQNELEFYKRQLISTQSLLASQSPLRDPRTIQEVGYGSSDNRALFRAQQDLNKIEKEYAKIRDIDVGKGFDHLKAQALSTIARIEELRGRVIALDQNLKGTTSKTKFDQIKIESAQAISEIELLKRELLEVGAIANATPGGPGGLRRRGAFSQLTQGLGFQGAGSGLGIVAGVAAATYGVSKFIDVSESAIEKATEQIRVNRLLASSAAEVGETYAVLAKKNADYADKAALSIVRTGEFTAKVAQLATRTARPENVDKLAKSFLDLGAARGLNPEELKTIIQQIITGQDEGYKKLLLPNPSLLYKQAADKQGRSVESLSALERARIFEAEFTKKAGLFEGAAQSRLESLDGQIAKTKATYENFINALSTSYSSGRGVFEFINTLEGAIKSLGLTTDEVREKLAQGLTPAEIVKEDSKDVGAYGAIQKARSFGYLIGGVAGQAIGAIPRALGFNDPASRFGRGLFSSGFDELSGTNDQNFQDEQLRRINALKRQDEQQKLVAEEGRKRLEEQNREEDTRRQASIAEGQFNRFLKKRDLTADSIQAKYREFLDQAAKDENEIYFSKEKLEDIAEKVGKIISQSLVRGFRSVLDDPKITFEKLQSGLSGVKSESRLDADDRQKLIFDFEKEIETQTNKVRSLKKETESFLIEINSRDNPFVKLFSEMATAIDRAEQKFGLFGKSFVDKMAEMEKAQIRLQIAQAKYLSDAKGLDYTQQIEILKNISYQQTDGFQRNLQFNKDSAEFVNNDRVLREQAKLAEFYARTFDPRSRFSNPDIYGEGGYLESQYGTSGLDKLSRDYTGGVSRNQFIDTQIQIDNLKEDLRKFQAIDTSKLGILGQATISEAINARIPANQELFQRLNSFGDTRQDARSLLELRAVNARNQVEASSERFNELIKNQEVAERTRRFAQEKVNLIHQQTGLDQAFTAAQLITVIDQLGPGELTASLRSEKLQALSLAKEAEQRQFVQAEERMNTIVSTLKSIDNAVNSKGIKLDKSTTPLLDVNIRDNTGGAVSTLLRPGQEDVLNRVGE